MSFQGTAPFVSPSEVTYFHTAGNPTYSDTVALGLLSVNNTGSSFESIYTINASGPETDNVYTSFAVGNVSGSVNALMVGLALDATHYFVASPGGIGAFLTEVLFLLDVGTGQFQFPITISPPVPFNTASAFLTFYFSISGTVATVYSIDQSTGLLANLASFDASAQVSAATLQTWSAGMYFSGSGLVSFQVKNYAWGPNSDLSPKTVPNVVGESQAQATTDIIAAGLVVGTVGTSTSSPPGIVLSQTPAPGTLANFGDPVNIVVSVGQLVSVYGKFVGSPVFPPTLLIDAKGIKPRIYTPKENVTVKT